MKKLSEQYITIYELKDLIAEYLEKNKRIYEQELLEAYLKEFADLDSEEAKKLKEEIKKIAPDLSEKAIVKILDVRPKTYEQLLLVLAQDYLKVDEEQGKKILELLASKKAENQE